MSDKVYLETDEEITSAIDKIASAGSSTVYVLVPRRASIVQSIVNLKLLHRQADILKKKIVLVTTDAGGRGLAKKAGLATQARLSGRLAKQEEASPESAENITSEADKESEELAASKLDLDYQPGRDSRPEDESSGSSMHQEIKLESSRLFPRRAKKKVPRFPQEKAKKKPSPLRNLLTASQPAGKSRSSTATTSAGPKPSQSGPRPATRRQKSKKTGAGKVFLLPSLSIKTFSLYSIISLVVLGLVFFLVLPKAEILIVPKTEPFSTSFEMVISQNISSIDTAKAVIPGELITTESKSDKKKFTASGEKEVGDKASGQVILYNNYSSEAKFLPLFSQLASQGLVFLTQQDVTIPGARVEGGETVPGQVRVRVEAMEPGENYNIGASDFIVSNLPSGRKDGFYGKNTTQFTGGSSRKVKVVSAENLDEAKQSLADEAAEEVTTKLTDDLGEDKILPEGLYEQKITEVEASAEIDTEADDFEMKVTVVITGLAFKKNDLSQLLTYKFDQLVPTEKYVVDESIEQGVTFEKVEQGFSDQEAATVKLSISKAVAWHLNEQKIKRDIKGKNVDEAKDYILSNSNVIGAEVSFWPFWVKKVPRTERKIEIMLDKEKIADTI